MSMYSRSARMFRLLCVMGVAMLLQACGGTMPESEAPALLVDGTDGPWTLSPKVIEGGPNPAPTSVQLTNTGDCEVDYSVTVMTVSGLRWLSVSPNTGTVAVGASATLSVAIDVVGPPLVPAGTHTGTITVEAVCTATGVPAIGSPAVISVNLIVEPLSSGISVDSTRIEQDPVTLSHVWTQVQPPGTPTARAAPTAVWTGYQVVVWGGVDATGATLDTGGRFTPSVNQWASVSTGNAPDARSLHTAVWTGSAMIVWGGTPAPTGASLYDTGGMYDPKANAWSDLPSSSTTPTARRYHAAVWTGSVMLVWGGETAVGVTNTGAAYDPVGATWSAMSTENAPAARLGCAYVWTGQYLFVWGGQDDASAAMASGGLYDPSRDEWYTVDEMNSPAAGGGRYAVWTGREIILWGGYSPADGGIYDPVANQWSPLSTVNAPQNAKNSVVWTGSQMLVWGAEPTDEAGGVYSPSTGQWTSMALEGSPGDRGTHVAVWTGRKLFIWGGRTSMLDHPTAVSLYE